MRAIIDIQKYLHIATIYEILKALKLYSLLYLFSENPRVTYFKSCANTQLHMYTVQELYMSS